MKFNYRMRAALIDGVYYQVAVRPSKTARVAVALAVAVAVQALFIGAISLIKPASLNEGLGGGGSDAVSVTLGQNTAAYVFSAQPDTKPVKPETAPPNPLEPLAAPAPQVGAKTGDGSAALDDPYARISLPAAANAAEDKLKLAGNIPAQVRICWSKAGSSGAVKLSMTLTDRGALMGQPTATGSTDAAALAAAVDAAKACAPYALGPAPGLMQTFDVELGGK